MASAQAPRPWSPTKAGLICEAGARYDLTSLTLLGLASIAVTAIMGRA